MYRDAPQPAASCYKHASAAMATQCERCARALCEPCTVFFVSSPHCIDCARRARRRQALAAVAKVGVIVGLLAAAIIFVVTRVPAFDYGAETPQIMRLRARVEAERCSQRATLEYDEALVAAGDLRGALADTDAYFTRCGDWYRLRWVTYGAYEHLGQHAAAVSEATKLIAHNPDDKDYPWWRGLAYEEMGRLDEAIRDYRRTLELAPDIDRIPFNLASVLEQKGQHCAARAPILQFIAFHPDFAQHPDVKERLERLRILGHCPPNQ
jgi:tetratricopeptide (TPR) repeat protein